MTKRKNNISTGLKSASRTLVDMNVVPHIMIVNSAARHPIKRGALCPADLLFPMLPTVPVFFREYFTVSTRRKPYELIEIICKMALI